MLTQILFEIPKMYEAAVASGELIRVGGLLKNAATGNIVAHLQESGLAQSILTSIPAFGSPAGMAIAATSQVLNAGTGVFTAIQVRKIQDMIEGLQTLQIATLGVSLVGIGVSVAGFAYMHKRMNILDGKIDGLMNTVNSGFDEQRKQTIRSHLSSVRGLVQLARQAHSLSESGKEYARVAESLAAEAAYFEGEVEYLSHLQRGIPPDLFWQLAQALMACNSVRIDCRLRTNEMHNALSVSEDVGHSYQRLWSDLTPVSFEAPIEDAIKLTTAIKDITDAAATKPYLIDHLRSSRIDGREYIAALENEQERPLLMLRGL